MRRLGRSNGVSCRRLTWSPSYRFGALPCRFSQPTSGQPDPYNQAFSPGPWHRLDKQLAAADIAQDQQWRPPRETDPERDQDSFLPSLVDRLERLDRAGFDATVSFDQPLRVRYPMITRQYSRWRILDELPRGRPTTQSSQGQRWRVPALRDLGVSHMARRNLELMGRPRRARAARPAAMHAPGDPASSVDLPQPRRN